MDLFLGLTHYSFIFASYLENTFSYGSGSKKVFTSDAKRSEAKTRKASQTK